MEVIVDVMLCVMVQYQVTFIIIAIAIVHARDEWELVRTMSNATIGDDDDDASGVVTIL